MCLPWHPLHALMSEKRIGWSHVGWSDGQSAVRQAGGRPSWSDYLRMDPTCRQAKSDRWSPVSLCVPYCKPCTTPTRFLQTVEKRIVKCAPLPRVFYKPLRTVLLTVRHSQAFFTNRGFFKARKNFLFSPMKNPRFVKSAWEWCTVCNTVLNGL